MLIGGVQLIKQGYAHLFINHTNTIIITLNII